MAARQLVGFGRRAARLDVATGTWHRNPALVSWLVYLSTRTHNGTQPASHPECGGSPCDGSLGEGQSQGALDQRTTLPLLCQAACPQVGHRRRDLWPRP